VIQDRESWQVIRAEGLTRYVLTRAAVLGAVTTIGYLAPRWGKSPGVDWVVALGWLAGGVLAGALWALFSWHMRGRAFE
jgi:hypothetical protein